MCTPRTCQNHFRFLQCLYERLSPICSKLNKKHVSDILLATRFQQLSHYGHPCSKPQIVMSLRGHSKVSHKLCICIGMNWRGLSPFMLDNLCQSHVGLKATPVVLQKGVGENEDNLSATFYARDNILNQCNANLTKNSVCLIIR